MTRAKIKIIFLWHGKEVVPNSYQKNCFLIINSNNQELIHHIHYLGYIFYY